MGSRKLSARSTLTESRVGYHADAGQRGLYLQVAAGGSALTRSWIFRFVSPISGRRRDMGLGNVDNTPLSRAREAAHEFGLLVRQGLDPIEQRQRHRAAQRLAAARVVTFKEAVKQCIEAKRPEWSNAKHAAQWLNTLSTYCSKNLGDLPVADIDTASVLGVLEPIWTTKTETATRVRQRIETVLDWATARGYRTGPNPAALKGNLAELLPRARTTKKVIHHPALPYRDIHGFVQALRCRTGISALALEFLILTAARTGEVIGALWREMDLGTGVWSVPSERMKARREHLVPLNARALEILRLLEQTRTSEYVFPGQRVSRPAGLSGSALLELMRGMEEYARKVPHGFRSTFRDWAGDSTSFPPETIELALAHTIRNKTEAAYRRGSQLDKRRKLMASWLTFIETAPRTSATVTHIGGAIG